MSDEIKTSEAPLLALPHNRDEHTGSSLPGGGSEEPGDYPNVRRGLNERGVPKEHQEFLLAYMRMCDARDRAYAKLGAMFVEPKRVKR